MVGHHKDSVMKRTRVTVAVVVAVILMNHPPAEAAQTAQSQTESTASEPNYIQDPAEYHAYITALHSPDPLEKGPALEAFAKQYPQSPLLIDALGQAVAAYRFIGNAAKMAEVLKRILEPIPSDLRDLAVTVAADRVEAELSQNPVEGCSDAQTGLQRLPGWQKPEGITDSSFVKIRKLMSEIFFGAAGLCALKKKDYVSARGFYENAFQVDPTNVRDLWQLSVADLEMNSIDVNGLWYCAKAINLVRDYDQKYAASAVNPMTRYCKSKYEKYHGSEDGWDQIVRKAARENAPPSPAVAKK
jgi:tetratricopeptide (TPR) repeat protein